MSRWKLVFLSLFAVVAMSAVASASASALEFYNSSGELITTLLQVRGLGGLQRLQGEVTGVKLEVHCTTLHTVFSIHNGLVGGVLMGLGLGYFLYLGCVVSAPKPKNVEGCEVSTAGKAEGEIQTEELNSLAITQNSEPYIEFTPKGGTAFVKLVFSNCKNTALNGSHEVTGLARGKVNNTTSEVEAKTGTGELEFAGNPATYEGAGVVEMEGGGKIKVE